jgi:hypothetical protein
MPSLGHPGQKEQPDYPNAEVIFPAFKQVSALVEHTFSLDSVNVLPNLNYEGVPGTAPERSRTVCLIHRNHVIDWSHIFSAVNFCRLGILLRATDEVNGPPTSKGRELVW